MNQRAGKVRRVIGHQRIPSRGQAEALNTNGRCHDRQRERHRLADLALHAAPKSKGRDGDGACREVRLDVRHEPNHLDVRRGKRNYLRRWRATNDAKLNIWYRSRDVRKDLAAKVKHGVQVCLATRLREAADEKQSARAVRDQYWILQRMDVRDGEGRQL